MRCRDEPERVAYGFAQADRTKLDFQGVRARSRAGSFTPADSSLKARASQFQQHQRVNHPFTRGSRDAPVSPGVQQWHAEIRSTQVKGQINEELHEPLDATAETKWAEDYCGSTPSPQIDPSPMQDNTTATAELHQDHGPDLGVRGPAECDAAGDNTAGAPQWSLRSAYPTPTQRSRASPAGASKPPSLSEWIKSGAESRCSKQSTWRQRLICVW